MDIFYTTAPVESSEFLKAVLARCGVSAPKILRTQNGKPYLEGNSLFFSVAHTEGLMAIAVADREVGLDVERREARCLNALNARLTPREREEDFFELWTAKEAYIKFRGETLARTLPLLAYEQKTLLLNAHPVPVFLRHFQLEDCTLCVCTDGEEEITFIAI